MVRVSSDLVTQLSQNCHQVIFMMDLLFLTEFSICCLGYMIKSSEMEKEHKWGDGENHKQHLGNQLLGRILWGVTLTRVSKTLVGVLSLETFCESGKFLHI